MIEEIWKTIEGYPNYEVSNLGNVRSLNFHREKKSKIMKQRVNRCGYKYLLLCKDGKHKTFTVHQLVAKAFIQNTYNHPVVNHKDENKQNNCVNNLEWCTHKYNSNYGTAIERQKQNPNIKSCLGKFGKEHPNSKPINQYTKDGKLIRIWDSRADIGRELGINMSHISSCVNGKRKTAYGFIWKHAS